jgi:hypothetical protein
MVYNIGVNALLANKIMGISSLLLHSASHSWISSASTHSFPTKVMNESWKVVLFRQMTQFDVIILVKDVENNQNPKMPVLLDQ